MTNKQISVIIAHELFKCGDEFDKPATRIKFILKDTHGKERDGGGFSFTPLQEFIEKVLDGNSHGEGANG